MKNLLLLVWLTVAATFSLQAFGADVHLLCSGTKTFLNLPSGSGPQTERDKWEISFDESKKGGGLRFTVALAAGCFPAQHLKGERCDCKTTADEISCESAMSGVNNPSFKETSWFKVNRFSGRLTGKRSATYRDVTTQKEDWHTVEVEAMCEVFAKKKF
jgi:hypothetical protein